MRPKHIKEQRAKEVRRLWKRRHKIYQEKLDLGYIELKEPIRHGWFKEISITHKVERYKNEKAILEVYAKIEKLFWGRTKEEAEEKWNHQTSKYLIYKELPTLSKKQFNKLSDKAQRLCIPYSYRTEQNKLKIRFYLRIPKGSYRIKFTRAYITHSKRIDPTLERELDLIDQQLKKKGFYEADRKFYPWKDYWNLSDYRKEKLKTKRALHSLKKFAVEELTKENIVWEKN